MRKLQEKLLEILEQPCPFCGEQDCDFCCPAALAAYAEEDEESE